MATSEVQICNRALQKIGAARITSLTQDSKNARACNVAYEAVRDSELRKNNWNFAIKRAILAPDSTSPDFDYDYAFTLPTDCIKPIINDEEVDWVVEGRKILTNDGTTLYLRYVYQVVDPNEFDTIFREMLSDAIALAIADEVAQVSEAKIQRIERHYMFQRREAKRTNAIEKQAADTPTDSWISERL